MSAYRKPTAPRISRVGNDDLYDAETEAKDAFVGAANMLADVLDMPHYGKAGFFEQTLPEALYTFLDGWDSHAVRVVCETWLEKNPPD